MEDEFTLDVIPRHDVVSQLDWTPSSALIAPCNATRLFQKVVDVSTKTRRIGWTLSEIDFLYILLCHPFHIRQLLRVLNGTPAHTRATSKQGVNWSLDHCRP